MRNNKFDLLIKNSLRIFKKTKLLILQLMFLLLIGLTIILTIFSSISLLNQSKSKILNEGNLADITITIPDSIREKSINESNSDVSINIESPADKQLQEYLNNLGLSYTINQTINLNESQDNSTFIMYMVDNDSEVNKLITNNDTVFPIAKYNENYFKNEIYNSFKFCWSLRNSLSYIESNYNEYSEQFLYSQYMNVYKPWLFMQLISNGIWNLSNDVIENIIPIVQKLALKPQNENEYNQYYNIYNSDKTINKNSYWYKLRQNMQVKTMIYNGCGYNISCTQTIPLIGDSAAIPFDIQLYDITSYFAIASSNYFNASNKKTIPHQTLMDIMQLPLMSYDNNSINQQNKIYVYNPETNRSEPYDNFVQWLNNLSDEYKVYVNSIPYVLIDSGFTPDMLYPIVNENSYFIDSTHSGVLYVNQYGYFRSTLGVSESSTIYYSVRYPPDTNIFQQQDILSKLSNFTIENYLTNTAYRLDDYNQPNILIYNRAYFLNNLQNTILTIGIIIGTLIGFLSLFFICTLIRSIIKQNKNILGICIANGIDKISLAITFFPFALFPSIICAILSYIFSLLLTFPLNNIISTYWTLDIPTPTFNALLMVAIFFILFIILFLLIILVILWTLRKKTTELLNSSGEFRMNKFIIYSKKLTNLFSAFNSFRVTYIMGNIVRFSLLILIITIFTTLLSFTVGTYNQFSIAFSYTNRNKNYKYAFDLYTPTINGGYYSAMPYEELGISQYGMWNFYSSNGGTVSGVVKGQVQDVNLNNYYIGNYLNPLNAPQESFYSGKEYANALAYPYSNDKYFTSLFMPNTSLSNQLNSNANFFNNKIFIKALLDVYIDVAGSPINAWEIAKSIAPTSILNIANNLFQEQIEVNYQFYYWLQQQNNDPNSEIYYSTYLPNVYQQPFTIDGSDISDEYLTASNKKEWIFIKEYNNDTNAYEWVLNSDNAVNSAPTYTIKSEVVQLCVQMLTNSQNTLFQNWYKYVYDKNPNKGDENQIIPEFNYKIGYGVIPLSNDDETYTYINGDILSKNNENINTVSTKIVGIKSNSNFVTLYDENNNDISYLLESNTANGSIENPFPLIINEVVQKLYSFDINDVLEINATNLYDRFNRKNLELETYNKVYFKIVGITSSKSEQQYFTLQKYANKILGFQTFDLPNQKWNGPNNPGYGYVPFNGVYTNEENPRIAYNYGGVYSPSGLTTSKGIWDTNIGFNEGQTNGGELLTLIENAWDIIPTIMHISNIVDYQNNNEIVDGFSYLDKYSDKPNDEITNFIQSNILYTHNELCNNNFDVTTIGDWVRKLVSIFDTDQPIITMISSIDTTQINLGQILDSTFSRIEIIVISCFIPVLLIILFLIAFVLISESNKLIALMKVLGVSDIKNIFLFMFMYYIVLFLGIIISIPLTYLGLQLTSLLIFNGFKIIISPSLPYYMFLICLGIIGLVFSVVTIYAYDKIKKINVPQSISVR